MKDHSFDGCVPLGEGQDNQSVIDREAEARDSILGVVGQNDVLQHVTTKFNAMDRKLVCLHHL